MEEKKNFVKLSNGEILNFGESRKIINGELTIQKFINGYSFASRTSIINHIITKYGFKKYLEIGVRRGENFKKINVEYKKGVDPEPLFEDKYLFKGTSDDFFIKNKDQFDIIFIDGLHLEYQVDKDIFNSLNVLTTNGFIILHDCNPPTKFHQREKYEINGELPPWNGTVWKSFVKLHMTNPKLKLHCVDCDWGIGIIQRGESKLIKKIDNLNYDHLEKERGKLLNLISVKDFLSIF